MQAWIRCWLSRQIVFFQGGTSNVHKWRPKFIFSFVLCYFSLNNSSPLIIDPSLNPKIKGSGIL